MQKCRFDGLSEFISRRTRIMLLELARERLGSLSAIAEKLGVTRWAVCKWFDPKETHPNNENTEKIIALAEGLDRIKTREILLDEALEYLGFVRARFCGG